MTRATVDTSRASTDRLRQGIDSPSEIAQRYPWAVGEEGPPFTSSLGARIGYGESSSRIAGRIPFALRGHMVFHKLPPKFGQLPRAARRLYWPSSYGADPVQFGIVSDYDHSSGTPGELSSLAVDIALWPYTPMSDDLLGILARLQGFKNLEDGWAGGMQPASEWGEGYGKAPSPEGLAWLQDAVSKWFFGAPVPFVYPTPEGAVQFEWDIGPYRPSLEIDLETHSGEWHCLDLGSNESYERDLALESPQDWAWLGSELHLLQSKVT